MAYLNPSIRKCGGIFDKKAIQESISELQLKTTQPNFWDDNQSAQKILKNISVFENDLKMWQDLEEHYQEVESYLELLNEGEEVMKTFADNIGVKVIRANAQQYFYDSLSKKNDPESKRKIIGRAFIDIFNQEAQKLIDIKFLAQGTIYPDVIESAGADSGKAKVIKSHHNVGGLPENMQFELVEPLKELFKDEVRTIGMKLGLPKKC